jgi:hypothetical protein
MKNNRNYDDNLNDHNNGYYVSNGYYARNMSSNDHNNGYYIPNNYYIRNMGNNNHHSSYYTPKMGRNSYHSNYNMADNDMGKRSQNSIKNGNLAAYKHYNY